MNYEFNTRIFSEKLVLPRQESIFEAMVGYGGCYLGGQGCILIWGSDGVKFIARTHQWAPLTPTRPPTTYAANLIFKI